MDDCGGHYVIIGSLGELAKLNQEGKALGETAIPLASAIPCSTAMEDSWIGVWVEAEMRLARMASLNLADEWKDGASKRDLRTSLNPMSLHPKNSRWSHALDAEPTCVRCIDDGFCFVLRGRGIYRMDSQANEIWRSSLPSVLDGKLRGLETAISISQYKDSLSIWYDNGLIVDITSDTGLEIDRRSLKIHEKVERVFHSETSHLLALAGGGFLISDGEHILDSKSTPGPLSAARENDGVWDFTGWRFDGRLSNGSLEISARDQLGIGFVSDKVLTNDGTLSDFAFTHS